MSTAIRRRTLALLPGLACHGRFPAAVAWMARRIATGMGMDTEPDWTPDHLAIALPRGARRTPGPSNEEHRSTELHRAGRDALRRRTPNPSPRPFA